MKQLPSFRAGSIAARFLATSLLLAAAAPPLRAQLVFEFTPGPGLMAFAGSDPATAMKIGSAVTAAGAAWSSLLIDPITIKITVDLDPGLPSSVFAAAFATKVDTSYTAIAGALGADALSATDASAVASLQPGPKIEALTHDTSTLVAPSPEIRLGGATTGIWNSTLAVPRANLKALGLIAGTDGSAGAEGTLMINSTTFGLFDFVRYDPVPIMPIEPGKFDFTGIAIHELGHLMGFLSGVDEVDYAGDGAPGNPADLSSTAIFTVLDLFRYSPHSLLAESQPTTGAVNDWRFGPPPAAFLPAPGLSVDGGATYIAPFATGAEHGDGAQASHFADGVPAIMDPGFGPGVLADPTSVDIIAMDAIGWNVVPEPATGGLLLLCVGAVGFLRLRRARKVW
jgi:hypothetical protein